MAPNQLLLVGISAPELSLEDAELIRAVQPAGFVLAGPGLRDVAQGRRLTDALRRLCVLEPLICLQSGPGTAWPDQLLGTAAAPSPEALRDHGDRRLIMTAGWIAGRLLRLVGVNLHLAPSLAIGDWGDNDQEVINHAGVFNRFQRKQGVLGGGLPFPGGPSCADLDIDALLRSQLLPFTALMPELDAIVVGDTVFAAIDPGKPASSSPTIITRLLRGQLGYQRLVVAGGRDGAPIAAGADLLRLPDVRTAPDAMAAMRGLSGYQLADAVDRVEHARKRLHAPTRLDDRALDHLERDARDLLDRM